MLDLNRHMLSLLEPQLKFSQQTTLSEHQKDLCQFSTMKMNALLLSQRLHPTFGRM